MLTGLTLAASGGIICLGIFLAAFLAGTDLEFPCVYRMWKSSTSLNKFVRRFQTTSRANPLAQRILKAVIEQGLNNSISSYAPDNCKLSRTIVLRSMTSFAGQSVNGTDMPDNFNYNDPSLPFVINGRKEPTSQRFKV